MDDQDDSSNEMDLAIGGRVGQVTKENRLRTSSKVILQPFFYGSFC